MHSFSILSFLVLTLVISAHAQFVDLLFFLLPIILDHKAQLTIETSYQIFLLLSSSKFFLMDLTISLALPLHLTM